MNARGNDRGVVVSQQSGSQNKLSESVILNVEALVGNPEHERVFGVSVSAPRDDSHVRMPLTSMMLSAVFEKVVDRENSHFNELR